MFLNILNDASSQVYELKVLDTYILFFKTTV